MIVIVGMSEIPRIPLKLAFLQGCETLVEGSWTAECQYALPQGIDKSWNLSVRFTSSLLPRWKSMFHGTCVLSIPRWNYYDLHRLGHTMVCKESYHVMHLKGRTTVNVYRQGPRDQVCGSTGALVFTHV